VGLVQSARIQHVSGGHQEILVTIQHVSFGRVRYLAEMGMPERLAAASRWRINNPPDPEGAPTNLPHKFSDATFIKKDSLLYLQPG